MRTLDRFVKIAFWHILDQQVSDYICTTSQMENCYYERDTEQEISQVRHVCLLYEYVDEAKCSFV